MSTTLQNIPDTDPDDIAPIPSRAPARPDAPAITQLPDAPASQPGGPFKLRDNRPPAPDEPFEIVETDDDFRPLEPSQPREQRLDDQTKPLLEQRQADQQAPANETQEQRDQREDQEAIRRGERPRRTRAEQRQARREGRDRTLQQNAQLQREVAELRQALAGFEPRFAEIDQSRVADQLVTLDRGIEEQKSRAVAARRRMSEAMIAQDSDAFASALDERDAAIMRAQELTVHKNVLSSGNPLGSDGPQMRQNGQMQRMPQPQQQFQPQPQAPMPQPLTGRARALADEFAQEHPWIDFTPGPDGRPADPDSRIIQELDNSVIADGFDPGTFDYWDELRDRGRKYLRDRFPDEQPPQQPAPRRNGNGAHNQSQQNQPQQQQPQAPAPERRGPMVAGGGERAPAGRNQVYISPARKDALMLAGVLGRDGVTVEDPQRFQRYLKQYQAFDRANGVARQ